MSASYPGSVKSFASRSPGQVIGSAHINDLQDEVAAIEQALVVGPITLTSPTLSGTVVFAIPTVRVTHSVDQGVPTATFTGLNWDTETYDSHAMHSTSANSSRITFAGSTGVYAFGVNVAFNPNSSGTRQARIQLNDGDALVSASFAATPGGTFAAMNLVGAARIAATTDYITVQVFQNSGSTGSVAANSTTIAIASFWAHKVSA